MLGGLNDIYIILKFNFIKCKLKGLEQHTRATANTIVAELPINFASAAQTKAQF